MEGKKKLHLMHQIEIDTEEYLLSVTIFPLIFK